MTKVHPTRKQLMAVYVVFNQRIQKNCFNALLTLLDRVLIFTSVFNPPKGCAQQSLYVVFMKKNVLALSIAAALVGLGFAGGAQAIGLLTTPPTPPSGSTANSLRTSPNG